MVMRAKGRFRYRSVRPLFFLSLRRPPGPWGGVKVAAPSYFCVLRKFRSEGTSSDEESSALTKHLVKIGLREPDESVKTDV